MHDIRKSPRMMGAEDVMNTKPRCASDVLRDVIRHSGSLADLLFGAVVSTPLWLILAGQWVRGLQVSLLLASAVAIIAASSPWWVDAIEQREIDRVLRGRGENLP